LGGIAIAAGYGLTSTGYVGCGLAFGGLIVWWISRSFFQEPATPRRAAVADPG
jgi:predicted MFS family arabinose efflux permease